MEDRAKKLKRTLARTFAPVKLTVDRAALASSTVRLQGVTRQAERLRAVLRQVERERLTGLPRALDRIRRTSDAAVRSLRRIPAGLRNVARRARETRFEVGGLQTAIAALGTGLVIRSIINNASAFQRLQRRIKAVSGSVEETEANFDRIRQVSEETGTSIERNAATFARLRIATRNLGVDAERTVGILRTLNQAFIVGGSSSEEVRSAITQLGQALASGRLQGDELRSLLESAPLLAEKLAEQLGVTIGELRAMGAAGELTSERLVFALEGAAGDIDAAFKQLGPSFEQSVARLSNAFIILGEQFGPFIENLGEALEFMARLTTGAGDVVGQFRRRTTTTGAGAAGAAAAEEARVGAASSSGITVPFIGTFGRSEDIDQQPAEQDRLRFQQQRLGNELQLFPQGEDTQVQLANLREGLNDLGVNATLIAGIIAELGDQTLTLGEKQDIAAGFIGVTREELIAMAADTSATGDAFLMTAGDLSALGDETQRIAGLTTDYVTVQDQATAKINAAAESERQLAELRRRTGRALKGQLQNLDNQRRLIGLEGVERDVLMERLRAEQAIRKAGLDIGSEESQAALAEIEALARGNAELAERLRLLRELPGAGDEARTQMEDFTKVLIDARDKALQLGDAFANALVSGIDRTSDALAEFAISGANDLDALKEQLSNILRNIAKDIVAAIIKALILRAITSGISGGAAARTGASASAGRRFFVNEGGPELFVPSRSPLSASVAASRASRRVSSSASRFATRVTGGSVLPGSGGAFIPGSGLPTPFTPPSSGTIVPAAETAAILNRKSNEKTTVIQAPAPEVSVSVTPQIIVGGKVFREAIRNDDQVQAEIATVVRDNQDGIQQGGRG
jgi:tape measure domain-containing protein